MESGKSRLGAKQLRRVGRKLIGRPEPSQSKLNYPEPSQSKPDCPGSSQSELGGPEHAQSKPGISDNFLTRSLDTSWIDVEMMGHWMHKCDTEHGNTCRGQLGSVVSALGRPQLLIDVRKKCLALAESSHVYACLSYVWGGAPTLKTNNGNLNSLMRENSLEFQRDGIPRTIRDTICLVDQLGIPYLWVDSLCIVQDDNESKHDQIQAMAGIYANSYVTIIAGNGWDANHGLRGIQGVTEPRHLSSFLKTDFEENLQPYSGIWYSRGWTLQEMIFSPRKIMFQYQLAIWECNSNAWHESSLTETATLASGLFDPSINPWNSRVKFSPWPDVEQYVSIVSDFANRKLTYPEDGLNAVSSLLTVMNSSFLGGFISGLPEMFLDEALLWQPAEPMQRRGSNSLPSWSWAGWEGQIIRREWMDHWAHLKGLRSPSSRMPLRPVISAVTWFFGDTLEERTPANISGHTYMYHIFDTPSPLPPNWSSNGLFFYYNNERDTKSAYPLPTAPNQPPRVITARYLYCRTKRAYFKTGTRSYQELSGGISNPQLGLPAHSISLHNKDDHLIGVLNLNLALDSLGQEPPDDTEYELVIISAGEMEGFVSATQEDLPDIVGWGHFSRGFHNPRGTSVLEIYYVLWIGWKDDGTAYRKGLGRILKDAWDSEATEEIDLVLG